MDKRIKYRNAWISWWVNADWAIHYALPKVGYSIKFKPPKSGYDWKEVHTFHWGKLWHDPEEGFKFEVPLSKLNEAIETLKIIHAQTNTGPVFMTKYGPQYFVTVTFHGIMTVHPHERKFFKAAGLIRDNQYNWIYNLTII